MTNMERAWGKSAAPHTTSHCHERKIVEVFDASKIERTQGKIWGKLSVSENISDIFLSYVLRVHVCKIYVNTQ